MTEPQPPPKKSDLPVRAASAVVMVAVAGTALWLGGWWWTVFVEVVALGVLWEWWGLVARFAPSAWRRGLWIVVGLGYVAVAISQLLDMRLSYEGGGSVLLILGAVIFADIGAYFAGRTIGGPKIAPAISPSKTWAGLFGGMVVAAIASEVIFCAWNSGICQLFYPIPNFPGAMFTLDGPCSGYYSIAPSMPQILINGAFIAIIAQAGDFFESWMKRRAGVKDSGKLIPGHGGLFDRVDGLLAVLFVMGLWSISSLLMTILMSI